MRRSNKHKTLYKLVSMETWYLLYWYDRHIIYWLDMKIRKYVKLLSFPSFHQKTTVAMNIWFNFVVIVWTPPTHTHRQTYTDTHTHTRHSQKITLERVSWYENKWQCPFFKTTTPILPTPPFLWEENSEPPIFLKIWKTQPQICLSFFKLRK